MDKGVQEAQVAGQEGREAAAEAVPDWAVMSFGEFEDGVCQEREDVEGGERVGQMLFAVPEVVLQVVALGLELVVVAVLDMPAGSAARGQFQVVPGVHVQVGRPAALGTRRGAVRGWTGPAGS